MDIRTLFKQQTEKNKGKQDGRKAPVIVDSDDEDDFKSSNRSKGGGRTRGSGKERLQRKRSRARRKYDSDSEEEVPVKRTRVSPRKAVSSKSVSAKTAGKGTASSTKRTPTKPSRKATQKSPADSKRKEVKSVSDFFGSAPIKRSSELKSKNPPPQNSGATDDSLGKDGQSGGRGREKGGGGGEVVVIPESPTDMGAGLDFDDEAVAMALEEDEKEMSKTKESHDDTDFSKTLEELDQPGISESSLPPSLPSTPPTKKLRLMMERLPITKHSPTKSPSTRKSTKLADDDDFTDSPILRRSPLRTPSKAKQTGKKVGNVTPSKANAPPSQAKGEEKGSEELARKSKLRAEKRIKYIDDSDEEEEASGGGSEMRTKVSSPAKDVSLEGDASVAPPPTKKTKPDPPSKPVKPDPPSKPVKPVVAASPPVKKKEDKTMISASPSPKKPPPKPVSPPLKPDRPLPKLPPKPVSPPLKPDRPLPKLPPTTPSSSTATKTPRREASFGSAAATPKTPGAKMPQLGKAASYIAYVNRAGPKAPGSKPIPKGEENCLEGLTFVLTGVLDSMERDEAADLIKKYGGRLTSNMSKRTSYLVVGESAGESKLSKASSFGTKQIDEDGLLELVRTLPRKGTDQRLGGTRGKSKVVKKGGKPAPGPGRGTSKSPPQKANVVGVKEPTTPVSLTSGATSVVTPPTSSHVAKATPTSSHVTTPKTPVPGAESLLWVDRYRPKTLKQVVGQQGDRSNAKKLVKWLQEWERKHNGGGGERKVSGGGWGRSNQDDGSSFKAALLSGPPGVGKTTTATLVCEEVGYRFVELNASATRSKRTLHDEVAGHLCCLSMDAFVEGGGGMTSGRRHALIMDEVDGMAGNEDRGGVQELILMIKNTRIPIICICNDRQHPKIRSLANHCFDLRFQKPRVDQIKGAMMTVCYKEGIKISPQALSEIIMASGQDVRQVLNNLSVWSAADKTLTFEQAKETAQSARKEMKLNPFEVVRTVFMPKEGEREMTFIEKQELFFHDYNIAALFVQENYPSVRPLGARGDIRKTLDVVAETADSLCSGDVVERRIRSSQRWSLLPVQAVFSSVIPGALMRGSMGRPEFPRWLGQNSRRTKCDRMLQELQTHTRLMTSCNKTEFGMDYLPSLHSKLTSPLIHQGTEGVSEVVATMDAYDLVREDWDSVVDLAHYKGRPDVASQLASKVKAAFTRSYNKGSHMTHYASTTMATKKSRRPTTDPLGEEEEGGESEEELDEDLSRNPMVKAIKQNEGTGRKKGAGSAASGSRKGKGKAKGQSKGT